MWGLEYIDWVLCIEVRPLPHKRCILDMISNWIWWWGSSSRALGNEEYLLSVITPRFTWTKNSSTYLGPVNDQGMLSPVDKAFACFHTKRETYVCMKIQWAFSLYRKTLKMREVCVPLKKKWLLQYISEKEWNNEQVGNKETNHRQSLDVAYLLIDNNKWHWQPSEKFYRRHKRLPRCFLVTIVVYQMIRDI